MIVALSHGSYCCRHGLILPAAWARLSTRTNSAIGRCTTSKSAVRLRTTRRTRQQANRHLQETTCRCHLNDTPVASRWIPSGAFVVTGGGWSIWRGTVGGAWASTSRLPRTQAVKEWGAGGNVAQTDSDQFCVVNFYHLADLSHPEVEVERHKIFVEEAGLNLK